MKSAAVFQFNRSQVVTSHVPKSGDITSGLGNKSSLIIGKTSSEKIPHTDKGFQAVAENIPDVICRFDKKFILLYVNPAIEKATGIPQKVFIGKNPLDIGMPKDFVDYWNKHVQIVFSTAKQTTLEFTFPTPSGIKHFQSLVVPEFDDDGNVDTVLSISRDITDLKKLEEQKSAFIDIASHELKTPLTVLKAFAQLLEKRVRRTKVSKKDMYFIKNITLQADRLTNLINDLLDVGRIEAGRIEFKKKKFDLQELLKKVVVNFQYSVDTHSIILEGDLDQYAHGDEDRIEQVLINLITNAIKYSPKSDKVIVSVHRDGKYARISVRDFGFGISEKDKEKLFGRFYRTEDKRKQKISGFGLGLYISREIVEKHKGKIWVESEDRNLPVGKQGSTFSFTLPIHPNVKA